jgi:gliding motility-associated-like protein
VISATVQSQKPYTIQWSDPSFGAGLGPFTVNPSITTTYTITTTESDDATKSDYSSVVVTVNSLPTPTASVSPNAICINNNTTFSASSDAGHSCTYQWANTLNSNINSGSNVVFTAPTTLTAFNVTYTVTATDTHGCVNESSAVVTVNPLPVVSFAAITPNPYCVSDPPFALTGGTPSTPAGYYTGIGVSSNTFNPAQADTGTFTLMYHYTDTNGCTDSTSTTLTVLGSPIFTLSGTSTYCIGDTAVVNSKLTNPSAKDSYLWSDAAGSTTTTLKTIPALGLTTYTLTITNIANCSVSHPFVVTVNPYPTVNFTTSALSGCVPFTSAFTDNTVPSGGSYRWNFGDSLSAYNRSTLTNPSHQFLYAGLYDISLTVTTPPNCSSTLIQPGLITVYPVPKAQFIYTPPTPSSFKPDVVFTDVSTGDVLTAFDNWTFSDTLSGDNNVIGQSVVKHSFSSYGYYPVKLKVKNENCWDSTTVIIHVKADHSFYVPTAFTPNGDNLNDNFISKGIGIDPSSFRMIIYDRWGEKVYETTDMNKPWNGNKNNSSEVCPEGVYAWIITFSDMEGNAYKQEGAVTLIK